MASRVLFAHLTPALFLQVAPGNILCHHNKHFEFLHGSRIICFPCIDNISSKSYKRQRPIDFIFVNTIQYSHTMKKNIYHSNKRRPPPFFHSDTNPVLGHVLVHPLDKTHVLVVTVVNNWLLFLNILSFSFFPTNNKYLNLMYAVQSDYVPFFCSCLSPMIVGLRKLFLLTTPATLMLVTPSWVSRRKDVK